MAERLGINPTELRCLSVLSEGPEGTPAGRLAEITGLTTGAITRTIDRLEASGYVERLTDREDRRRVIVRPVAARLAELAPYFKGMEEAVGESLTKYRREDLLLLLDFLQRGHANLQEQILRFRGDGAETGREGALRAPLGTASQGRLVFMSGAAELAVRSEPLGEDLYRARFKGPEPWVRVKDGQVRVEYKRLSLADWAKTALGGGRTGAEISLNASIPWSVALHRGVSHVTARLGGMVLKELEIRGGASQVEVELPSPSGVVPEGRPISRSVPSPSARSAGECTGRAPRSPAPRTAWRLP
jgi:DNA-binding MarR family transcriptional regulator